jgi:hypothetical protein
MRPVVMVVPDVLVHQALQMAFIENDHMVKEIAAAVADPALRDAVLPRTAETSSLRLNAKALDGLDDLFIELCASVKDQVTRRGVVRERSRAVAE